VLKQKFHQAKLSKKVNLRPLRLLITIKQQGQLLMTSDARVLFKPGKQHEGWFNSDHLLSQVQRAIDIFEHKTNGRAQGLFLFDNASSHQKRASDTLSAWLMVKCAPPPIIHLRVHDSSFL
jgi:hypothetical protein